MVGSLQRSGEDVVVVAHQLIIFSHDRELGGGVVMVLLH